MRAQRSTRSVWLILASTLAACGGSAESVDAGHDAAVIDVGSGDAGPVDTCVTAAECDDGLFCTGVEACTAGRCAAGAMACDDRIACTVDACNEAMRTCTSTVPDADLDGHGDARCRDEMRGIPLGDDCEDGDANTFPGNTETCDAHDEDCNEATHGGTDVDVDGFESDACCNPSSVAGMPPLCGPDCDDTRSNVSRLATEACDDLDNDCDTRIDEDTLQMSWPDVDMDGFGDSAATPDIVCEVPSNRANQGGDCDDDERRVHPFQTEECNAVDDDCDGTTDEGATAACTAGITDTTAECVDGGCVVTGCAASHFDCNGSASDGCEAALCSDAGNCGGCGATCPASTFCGGGGPGICTGFAQFGRGGLRLLDVTGAPVAGATITAIGLCGSVSTVTAADGTYEFGPFSVWPTWARITASGYPTHVQPFVDDAFGPILTSALVDAWRADPDAAASPSADRAILVVDYAGTSMSVLHDGDIGRGNTAEGTNLLPFSGGGDREVYFDVRPGRMSVGGSFSDGTGCFYDCGPLRDVWLEPGAVTLVGSFSCFGVCS